MKETTATFTSVSSELVTLSEKIHQLIGYQAAVFDNARFRAPSTPEGKQTRRFLDELNRSSAFVRSLFETDPAIDGAQLQAKLRQYVEQRSLATSDTLIRNAVVDVGERLLGFLQEMKRHRKPLEKLAA